jgi:hypothetical protein
MLYENLKKPAAAFAVLYFLMIFSPIFADPANATNSNITNININGFSIGVKGEANFSQLPNDLRLGISANTPFFLGGWVALRIEADLGLTRGIPVTNQTGISNTIWCNYTAYKAGIVMAANRRSDILRPYIEFGYILISPSASFTSDPYAWGLYGILGFDIVFPGDPSGYFFEIGGTGLLSGGYADQYLGDPPYGSGLTVTLGWRFYL